MCQLCFNERPVTFNCYYVCPDCGKEWSEKVTLPQYIADVLKEKQMRVCCDACHYARTKAEQRMAEQLAERERVEASGIPAEFTTWNRSLGNIEAVEWVTANRGNNILLLGEVNTGKTRSIVKVLHDEYRRGKKVLYMEFNEFAEEYAAAMQDSIIKAGRWLNSILNGEHEIIVIDDIDKRRINETAGNLLYKLFNKIYSGEVTARFWFTANHRGAEMQRMFDNRDYGAAVVSRIERMMKNGKFSVKNLTPKHKGQTK